MWTIQLPVAVAVSKNKYFTLNLNHYRNAHYQVLNKAKIAFESVVKPLLKGVPKLDCITVEYVYYHGKGQVPDTNNVLTIADKFFTDTLVSAGVLLDDGPKYVKLYTFKAGPVDRDRPRIEAIIRSTTQERNQTMKLQTIATIHPDEVQLALKDYLFKQFPTIKNVGSLIFNLAQNGSYETRFETDAVTPVAEKTGKAPQRAACAQEALPLPSAPTAPSKPQEASADPFAEVKELVQGAANSAPAPEPKAASFPGLFSSVPQVSSPIPEKAEAVNPAPPAATPPSGGLFADWGAKPSN